MREKHSKKAPCGYFFYVCLTGGVDWVILNVGSCLLYICDGLGKVIIIVVGLCWLYLGKE